MKLFKYSLIAALALSGVLSACDDDVKYNEATPTPGVFFPIGENISKITIAPEAGEFEINVARYGFVDAQTYTFTNNFKAGEFSMPATVDFAENQMTTTVKVSYDGATLEPGVYNLEIGFADAQYINKFGETSLKIAVTLPEPTPVSDWNDLGECTFTDPFLTAGFYTYFTQTVSCKVHLEESGETPGLYRLVAPYGTAFCDAMSEKYPEIDWAEDEDFGYDRDNSEYLYFQILNDKNVVVMPQHIALAISLSHGTATVMNDAGYEIGLQNTPLDEVPAASFGVFKDGVVTIPARNALINVPGANADNPNAIYYANSQKSIKMVVFPGAKGGEFNANVSYLGQFNNAQTGEITAVSSVEFGGDVVAAKAALVKGTAGAASTAATAISEGRYSGELVDVDLSDPTIAFPLEMGGEYSVVVVTYDASGEAQDSGVASFEAMFYGDDAAWETLGYGQMADGWIIALFGYDQFDYAYDVLVSESKANPGIYRIKAPWGPGTPLAQLNQSSQVTDIFIDTRDQEFIPIMPQNSGFEYAPQLNYIYVCNREGYLLDNGYTKEEICQMVSTTEVPYITTTMEPTEGGIMITINPSWIIGNGSVFGGTGAGYVDESVIIIPTEDAGDEPSEAPRFVKKSSKPFSSRFHIAPNDNQKTRVMLGKTDKSMR